MDFDMDLRHTAQMDGGGGGGGEGPPKAPAATTFANDEEEEDKVGVRRIPQAANAATATITANWRRRLWNRQQQAQQPQGSTTYAAEEQPVTSNLTTSFVQGGKDQTDPKDFPSLSRLQGPPDLLNDVEQHNDDAWETSGYISSTDLDDEEEEDVEGHDDDDEDDSGHVERLIARHSQRRFQLRRRKNKKKTEQPEPPSNNNSVETSPAGPTSGPLSSSSPKPVTYAGMHSGQSKETRHNQVRSYREVVKGGIHPETSRKK